MNKSTRNLTNLVYGVFLVAFAGFLVTTPVYTSIKSGVVAAGGSVAFAIAVAWISISVPLVSGIAFLRRQAKIERLEMEGQSRQAKLEAMRLQLNPHFLFSSLNSTRMLISEGPERARHMITQLSRLLRATLERSQSVTVAPEEELELTCTYLDLEAVRFEERLTYQFDIDPDAKPVAVPPMIVQTLVENAVKHGIAVRKDAGSDSVEATVQVPCTPSRDTNLAQPRGRHHETASDSFPR